ncbi:MAG: hypothetical protein PWP54_1317 [Thermosipho sp. (in: thermotogales)]|jgi:hypothetical protein|nr:hypothetical protein [Thermosipho sp. (in: thermotogales)]
MVIKSLITIFSWAFILEIVTLIYYLSKGTRPFEFYLNLFLLIFTSFFLLFFIYKERKKLKNIEKDDEENKIN